MAGFGEVYNRTSGNPFMGLLSGLDGIGNGAQKRASDAEWKFEANRLDKGLESSINAVTMEQKLGQQENGGQGITWAEAVKRSPGAEDFFSEFMQHDMNKGAWGRGEKDDLAFETLTGVDTSSVPEDATYGARNAAVGKEPLYAMVARRKKDGKMVPLTRRRSKEGDDPVVMATWKDRLEMMVAQSSRNVGRPMNRTRTGVMQAFGEAENAVSSSDDPNAKISSFGNPSDLTRTVTPGNAALMYQSGTAVGLGGTSATPPAANSPAASAPGMIPADEPPAEEPPYSPDANLNVDGVSVVGDPKGLKVLGENTRDTYFPLKNGDQEITRPDGSVIESNTSGFSDNPNSMRGVGGRADLVMRNPEASIDNAVRQKLGMKVDEKLMGAQKYGIENEPQTLAYAKEELMGVDGIDGVMGQPGHITLPGRDDIGSSVDAIATKGGVAYAAIEAKTLQSGNIPEVLPKAYENQVRLSMEALGVDVGYVVYTDKNGNKKTFRVDKAEDDNFLETYIRNFDRQREEAAKRMKDFNPDDASNTRVQQASQLKREKDSRDRRKASTVDIGSRGSRRNKGGKSVTGNLNLMDAYGVDYDVRISGDEREAYIEDNVLPDVSQKDKDAILTQFQKQMDALTTAELKAKDKGDYIAKIKAQEQKGLLMGKFDRLANSMGIPGNFNVDNSYQQVENPGVAERKAAAKGPADVASSVAKVASSANSRPVVAVNNNVLDYEQSMGVLREAEAQSQRALTQRNKGLNNMELPEVTRENYLWTTKEGRAAMATAAISGKVFDKSVSMREAARFAATGKWVSDKELNDAYNATLNTRATIINQLETRAETYRKNTAAAKTAAAKTASSIKPDYSANKEARAQAEEKRKQVKMAIDIDTARKKNILAADKVINDSITTVATGMQKAYGDAEDLKNNKFNSEGLTAQAQAWAANPLRRAEFLKFYREAGVFIDPENKRPYPQAVQDQLFSVLFANAALGASVVSREDANYQGGTPSQFYYYMGKNYSDSFWTSSSTASKNRAENEGQKFLRSIGITPNTHKLIFNASYRDKSNSGGSPVVDASEEATKNYALGVRPENRR